MRRLLIATTLGLGLLAGGGTVGSAFARPTVDYTTSRATDRSTLIMPVHDDDYHRPYYAPPPRHWHRPEPRWHDQSRYDRDEGYHYGWR
jgi:hypothetical protein